MDRVSHLVKHFDTESTKPLKPQNVANFSPPKDDDIVIVSAIRTPICKSRRGGFKDTNAIDLLTPCLKYVVKNIDPKIVDDVCVGTVLAPGAIRANECRMACFLAGYPRTTAVRTVNRQCSSGLQAIADIAASIKNGYISIGVAAGVESMTLDSNANPKINIGDNVKKTNDALNCLLPMGITSENVVRKYGISRKEQDELAVLSHQRAFNAINKFKQEIIPVKTTIKNDDKTQSIVVEYDDGIRGDTNLNDLSKLKPAFAKDGTTTAGNSSQVSDGASAVLIMKRSKAKELGLKILGRFSYYAVAGVDPAVMGIGPAFAIPKVLEQAKLTTKDIDLYEINEAFASQAVYCVKDLGLSWDNVNVNGGAIAFGHPLGCTGCRMTTTLLYEMERRNAKRGIVSMCIGSGMGAAAIFERI